MTDASAWRLALARKIAPAYFDIPGVRAVLVGGSVARGCADRYSDIELGIFWDALPAAEERAAARERAHGAPGDFIPNNGRFDSSDPRSIGGLERYHLGGDHASGLLIEVEHETVGGTEQCLRDVLEGYDTSLSKHELIAVVQYGIQLYGEPLIERWRAQAAAYPDGLARKMVNEHLWAGPWGRKELYAERGEDLIVYEDCCWAAKRMLLVLMGLNRMYVPSDDFKWMELTIGRMRIAPPELAARLRAVFQADPSTAVRRLRALMEETLSLVARHMPEVDITKERAALEVRRQPWDYPPKGVLRIDIEEHI